MGASCIVYHVRIDSPRSHPRAAPRKPEGQPTRGKTHANRLRRVDNFLARYDPGLLRRDFGAWAQAAVVDLGYGAEALTTLEMAARLRKFNPALPVVGVEIDPERVAAAQSFADARTHFRLGGFNLPLARTADGAGESARLIRAFNVLRQYDEEAVAPAWDRMGRYLIPDGLLVEGTSDPFGRLWVANLLRKQDERLRYEALVFSIRLQEGFSPVDFQAVLPKNLIHRMTPGEPIHAFFDAWMLARRITAPVQTWGARQWFAASAQELSLQGWQVDVRTAWLRSGYLILRSLDRLSTPSTSER
jgi:hypothetical protein